MEKQNKNSENNLAEYFGASCSEKENRIVEQIDVSEELNITAEAKKIYESGGAYQYMIETCKKYHNGDEHIISTLILSFASTLIYNNELALNCHISGDAGSGKTHAVNTVLSILPNEYVLSGGQSDRALLYLDKLKPGTVICQDDQNLSETGKGIMKAHSGDATQPFKYFTVVNGKGTVLEIPERCVRWFVMCDTSGDGQTDDRELFLFSNSEQKHQEDTKQLILSKAATPTQHIDERPKLICKRIWEFCRNDYLCAVVAIPYALSIDADIGIGNRNLQLFLSMLRAATILAAPMRERRNDGKYTVLNASKEDFLTAAKIMNPLLAGKGGSQKRKFTKHQEDIFDYFVNRETGESKLSGTYAYETLRDALGINSSQLSQALNGRDTIYHTDGLCKIPGFDIQPNEYNPRKKDIIWNKEAYFKWSGSKNTICISLKEEEESHC